MNEDDAPRERTDAAKEPGSGLRELKRVVIPYVVFSVLWITLSDLLLESLVESSQLRTRISIYKGWGFVLGTALLLFVLLRFERAARERARRARLESERRYRAIFDSVGEAIFITDRQGRILESNKTARAMYRYRDEAELRALDVAALSSNEPPFTQEEAVLRVTEALKQETAPFPWRARRKDGTLFWTEVSLRPIGDGRETRILAVVRDTDERKRIEQELEQSHEKYEVVFRSSHDFVTLTERGSGVVLDANDAFCAVFGGREKILGRTKEELGLWAEPGDRAKFLERLEAADGQVKNLAVRLRLTGGETRDALMSAQEVSIGGLNCLLTRMHDVTEQRRIEDALRDSESRYKLIAENTDDVIWLFDLGLNRFVYVSPSVERLRGYTPAEILRQDMKEALTPESYAMVARLLPARIAAFEAGDAAAVTQTTEVEQTTKSGGVVPTEVVTKLIPPDPEGGAGLRILGVSRNISERRRAQAELLRNKTWLERAETIGRVGGWAMDLETGKVWASPEAHRLYGLPNGETDVATIRSIAAPECREALGERLRALVEKGEPYDIEFSIVRPTDGATLQIHSVAEHEPSTRMVFGVIRDVTEQRRTEAKVREQAALLDIANDAIYVRTLDGRIQFWNKGAERLYGWTVEEAEGRLTTELFAKGDVGRGVVQDELLAKGSWTGELEQKTKDGRAVVVLARLTLIPDASGAPRAVFAIKTDITEQKRLEARVLRAQRLESIGALASGIAHDLNNVLSPILLSVPLLKSEVRSAESLSMLDTVEASARRGADVVKQVLTFARGVPGERAVVRVELVLAEMIRMARETFPKNITIRFNRPEALWPIRGDATQVHQAIMNLFVNAKDAMPEGGELQVVADNLHEDDAKLRYPEDAKAQAYVCVSVTDTGVGIEPEALEKIFEPFFTTKPHGQGTGLGLSTVLGIMRSHGGFVRAHSRPGKGTTMELLFVATPDAAGQPDAVRPERLPRGQGETILLVDDEEAVRDLLRRVLERNGYKVIRAADGTEAVGLFVQNRSTISALLTDMMMPGMDGPSLVRILRRIDPGLPVLGFSGIEDRTSAKAGEALGLNAFLTKPFSNERLLTVVQGLVLQGGRKTGQQPPGAGDLR